MDYQTRRKCLRSIGTIGASITLAGCSGDDQGPADIGTGTGDNGDGTDSDDSTAVERTDATFKVNLLDDPTNQDYNGYNSTNLLDTHLSEVVWQPMAAYVPQRSEYVSLLAKDWSFNREGGTITLRDDSTWWPSGEPITAQDYALQHELGQFVTPTESPTFSEVQASGDYTIELTANKSTNPTILERVVTNPLSSPKHVFGEWLTKFQDAEGDEDAVSKIRKEITNTNIGNKQAFGSGPWKLTDYFDTGLIMEPHEGHFASDGIGFSTLEWVRTESNQQFHQEIINGNINGSWSIPWPEQSIRDQYPDGLELIEFPYYAGRGVVFNHEQEPLDDPRVHLAFAHAINQNEFTSLGKEEPAGDTYYSLLSRFYVDEWISSDVADQLVNYDSQDFDRAAAYLEDVDFSKEDGTWYMPNGDPFELEVTTAQTRVDDARLVAQHLGDFGVNLEVNALEPAVAFGNMNDGSYDIGLWDWGGGFVTHPVLDHEMTWDGWWNHQVMRIPVEELRVPSTFGDPSSDRKKINIVEKVTEARQTEDEQRMTELVQEMSWAYNQTLPSLPLNEIVDRVIFDTANFSVPNLDNPLNSSTPPHIINSQLGQINAK